MRERLIDKNIAAHFIWYVNINFTRKAWIVANGNLIDVPLSMTHTLVVSRDSVRTALMLEAMNGCDILCADVQNNYLNANPKEKVYFEAGE